MWPHERPEAHYISPPIDFFSIKKIVRKGLRKKNQVFGNGPIRKKKLPAFTQVAFKYPRQITD
jgi:hypothetical protein